MKYIQLRFVENNVINLHVNQEKYQEIYDDILDKMKEAQRKEQIFDYNTENVKFFCNPINFINCILMEHIESKDDPQKNNEEVRV